MHFKRPTTFHLIYIQTQGIYSRWRKSLQRFGGDNNWYSIKFVII